MSRPFLKRRLFYPKGEQILGLLTKGKEWMLNDTREEYDGPYHRFTDGIVMTLAAPSKKSKYLVPYKDLSSAEAAASDIYRKLTKVNVDQYIAPSYYYPKKREIDISKGYIERYFVQKKNEPTITSIVEIDKKQYDKVSITNKECINGNLYYTFLLRWKITGTEAEIKQINLETLTRLTAKYPGIRQYLGDLTEFSIFFKLISE
jgi:hypothetical protein